MCRGQLVHSNMGSRLRLDPEHLFEVFIEFGKPANEKEQPCILQCFPEDFEDEEVLRSSPKFAFPYQSDYESSGVEHFTFVLTDIDSRFKFSFCRLSANAETCLCIISCLPWFEIFYKFLDRLSDHLNSNDDKSISLLSKLYEIESFEAGESVLLYTIQYQFAVRMSPSSSKLSSVSSSMLSSSLFSKHNSTALPTSQSNVWSSGSESRAFVSTNYEAPLVKKEKEAPLFTLKQVNTICKNMVTEHEHRVRQEYDKVLNNKLAEQYENFLKFNHDQLHKRFGNSTASYVS